MHNYFWKARPVAGLTDENETREPNGIHGIRDRVAIVGMGCTPFGEHWDKSVDDLVDRRPPRRPCTSAGVTQDDIDAFWLGTMGSGVSGLTLSRPLQIDYKPVTRLENMCATGSEAFRNACYAVASGAYDMVMAVGVEKLKDSGFSGPHRRRAPRSTAPTRRLTAPAMFSLLAPAYAKKYGVDEEEMKDVLTRIAWKNHKNGALEPAGPVPEGSGQGDHLQLAARRRPARHLRLLGRVATARPPRSSSGPRTPTATPTSRST